MSFVRSICIFLLISFISIISIGGCGSNEKDDSNNSKFVKCGGSHYCSGNPGVCCKSNFFSGTQCEVGAGTCCQDEFPVLCPDTRICVQDVNQCPNNSDADTQLEVLIDENICNIFFSISEPDIFYFFNNWHVDGIITGPVGTELSFELFNDNFEVIDLNFRCQKWRDCIRSESSPPTSSWSMNVIIRDRANNIGSNLLETNEFSLEFNANNASYVTTTLCPDPENNSIPQAK